MMNLLVEIGNTALKAAWCEGTVLGRCFRYQGEKKIDYILSLTDRERPETMTVACVYSLRKEDMERLESICGRLVLIDPSHKEVLERHSLPSHLSPDRAAAVIAARNLFNGRSCTVFDFGTILSVDFMSSDGSYEGGLLSPGFRTRFKSMNRYSKNLPAVDMYAETTDIGNDIINGIISGIMFEIQGHIDAKPENIIVFTGGDANYFANKMKNSIFVICNLILMGLALITNENEKRLLQ